VLAGLGLVVALVLPVAAPAAPAAAIGQSSALGGGFDACAAPSTSLMKAWWSPSPYWWVGIYIGGSERACRQRNLTAAWVRTTSSIGWGFEPLRVGAQMSSANGCSSIEFSNYISRDLSRAWGQGWYSAEQAVSEARDLGFGRGSIIYYDLEAYSTSKPACVAAAGDFVRGWVRGLHYSGFHAGVYGGSCGSDLASLAHLGSGRVPDAINGAAWDGNPHTSDLPCVSTRYWVYSQRLKQYRASHNETHGGYKLNIDSDCANGPIDDARAVYDTGDGCSSSTSSPATAPGVLAPSSATTCATGQLALAHLRTGLAGTTVYYTVVLRNRWASPCRLAGYPKVQLRSSSWLPMTTHAQPGGAGLQQATLARAIELAPGAEASATLSFSSDSADAAACPPAQGFTLATGNGGGVSVPVPLDPCGGTMGVTSFTPGANPPS
jgi:hypothetical protein